MYTLARTSRSWFTLIELMIAMVIFTIMTVMVMTVYLNTTNHSRKLNATRQLSEVAREITERLSQDVREKGILMPPPDLWLDMWDNYEYTLSWSEYLALSWGLNYIYGSMTDSSNLKRCVDTPLENTQSDNNIHCGLYINRGGEYYNIVDSFVSEESKKRVKIQNLRFYVSGWPFTTKKVTLIMTLSLMPRIGVPPSLVENTKIHIQTTISERSWKK